MSARHTPDPSVVSALLLLPLLLSVGACTGSPGAPAEAPGEAPAPSPSTGGDTGHPENVVLDELTITVATTGGIAGMDWQVRLDGAAGEIRVERCGNNCPWTNSGLRAVPGMALEEIVGAFVEAGVTRRAETDYGMCAECADQFNHVIEYRDADAAHRVQGDGANFPRGLQDVVNRLIWETDPASSTP